MGQVPYGIIGNGKVARHFKEYFTLKNINFLSWDRSLGDDPVSKLRDCETVLILIKDDAIGYYKDSFKKAIHFSGSLVTDIPSFHPLMNFGNNFYTLEEYERIPFVCDNDVDFLDYFPKLVNPYIYIDKKMRPIYHALLVLAGNFSTILWDNSFKKLEQLGIDRKFVYPYLDAITKNLKQGEELSFGPLIRHDYKTMETNLNALKGDPFYNVYLVFKEIFE